jgi:hypothetical protein
MIQVSWDITPNPHKPNDEAVSFYTSLTINQSTRHNSPEN